MTIQFEYNKKQVLRALRYHFFSKKDIRILILVVNGFALISALLYYTEIVRPLAFLIGSFLWLSLMFSFWWLLPLKVYRSSQTFRESLEIEFGPEEMIITHSGGRKHWAYSSFQTMKETPEFFYLYVDPRSFFLIPMDAFEDAEAIRLFKSILNQRITNSL
jgi:hypothetical protein